MTTMCPTSSSLTTKHTRYDNGKEATRNTQRKRQHRQKGEQGTGKQKTETEEETDETITKKTNNMHVTHTYT